MADNTSSRSRQEKYGLWAVIVGLVVLAGLTTLSIALMWKNPDKLPGIIGAVASPVVAIVTAYLGLKIGTQQGAAATEAAMAGHDRAQKAVAGILADLEPAQANWYVHLLNQPESR